MGFGDDLSGRFRGWCTKYARTAVTNGRLARCGKDDLADPSSAILDIDRKVAETMRSAAFPTKNFSQYRVGPAA